MDNQKIGVTLIVFTILVFITLLLFKLQVNNLVKDLMDLSGGICIADGKCVHQQSNLPIYLGIFIILSFLFFAFYLLFFDKSQKMIKESHEKLIKDLENTKIKKDDQEKFEILLQGLDDYEKGVMKAVRDQDGIQQSTLRIRTGMSKTKLSMVLQGLEKKGINSKSR